MPTIDDLTRGSKKKFIKSDYRPWNYMEEIDKETISNQLEVNEESIANHLELIKESNGIQMDINNQSIGNHLLIDESINLTNNKVETALVQFIVGKKNIDKSGSLNEENPESTLDIIFRLTGHQKKIFLFITDRCASRALLSTGVIKGETLAEITNTTIKMVKTSIQRLIGKQLIIRERGKTGRGGFYCFKLTDVVRNAAIEYKRMIGIDNQLGINKESVVNHLGIKPEHYLEKKQSLPDEWISINIHQLEDIGFNINHLADVYETKLADPLMVQESILHFAYGIEYESTKYKQYEDLLNVLIGRLRKGKPWFEKNYRSPQEIAQSQLLENKKNELERKKKIEDDAFKLALTEWQDGLDQTEIDKITTKKGNGDIIPPAIKLSIYFRETLWPAQKKLYLIME